MIMIIATFGQAVSGNAPAVHIIGVLIVWRFIVRLSLYYPILGLLTFFHRWVSVLVETILYQPSSPQSSHQPRFVVV
jgi:ABC-type multidrug transport system permease subunit